MMSTRSSFGGGTRWMVRHVVRMVVFVSTLLGVTSAALSQSAVIEGKDAWLFPGWESHDQVDQAGIARSIDLIRNVKIRLEARKIGLVVVVAPMKAPFYQDRLNDNQKLSKSVIARYVDLITALSQAQVPTVDLVGTLKMALKEKQSAFFRADYHWTAWAAEASANATAEVIQRRWKLRGKPGDGLSLGEWTNERRFGDLAANFMNDDQRNRIGREVFTVRRPTPETAKSLTDDTDTPVHVIGNSFVQPYLGFPQALSHALDRKVSLSWNPGNVGPWATFLQYIDSHDFKANPPQVIVWQFNEAQMHQGPDAKGQWEPKTTMDSEQWLARVQTAIGQ